jgi:hypothetical protein
MINGRYIALIKVFLDVSFIVIVVAVYFVDIFNYMDKYNIGVYRVVKKENYLTSNLIKQTEILYLDFDKIFCAGTLARDVEEICGHKASFENAGILYITFSVLSHFIVIYSILGMLGIFCKCSSLGVVSLEVVHYIYPALYASSLIMYVATSKIFSLTVPTGYSASNYNVTAKPGIVLMIIALIFAISSGLLFLFTKKQLKSCIKVKPEAQKPGLRKRTLSK